MSTASFIQSTFGHWLPKTPTNMSETDIGHARVRARHRLIGMTVLVILSVAALSWLLKAEPRPNANGIQMINATDPEVASSPQINADKAATKSATHSNKQAKSLSTKLTQIHDSLDQGEEVVGVPTSQPVSGVRKEPAARHLPEKKTPPAVKPTIKPESKPATDKADKTATLLRYVVQVGAFQEATLARATRMKVEALGLKTYTQVLTTASGKSIRVRVGPFTSQAQAQKALATIRKAGMAGGILTL